MIPNVDDDLFESNGGWVGKVRCRICGRDGYPQDPENPDTWQAACRRGHGPCPECGYVMVLRRNGTARRCAGYAARLRHKREVR